jgi:hypothetical protein
MNVSFGAVIGECGIAPFDPLRDIKWATTAPLRHQTNGVYTLVMLGFGSWYLISSRPVDILNRHAASLNVKPEALSPGARWRTDRGASHIKLATVH